MKHYKMFPWRSLCWSFWGKKDVQNSQQHGSCNLEPDSSGFQYSDDLDELGGIPMTKETSI